MFSIIMMAFLCLSLFLNIRNASIVCYLLYLFASSWVAMELESPLMYMLLIGFQVISSFILFISTSSLTRDMTISHLKKRPPKFIMILLLIVSFSYGWIFIKLRDKASVMMSIFSDQEALLGPLSLLVILYIYSFMEDYYREQ